MKAEVLTAEYYGKFKASRATDPDVLFSMQRDFAKPWEARRVLGRTYILFGICSCILVLPLLLIPFGIAMRMAAKKHLQALQAAYVRYCGEVGCPAKSRDGRVLTLPDLKAAA
jgi:hypothetical protein